MTTIRVQKAARDRAECDDLLWQAIDAAYRRLSPEQLADHRAEAEAFGALDLTDLADTAAIEFPEYNGPE